MELPVYVKAGASSPSFYKAMFARQVEKEDGRTVFLEYAWDMRWCDPCAADPLSSRRAAPARRLLGRRGTERRRAERVPHAAARALRQRALPRGSRVPGDGRPRRTSRDATSCATRGPAPTPCSAAAAYRQTLRERREQEAEQLASLTGWNLAEIRKKMGLTDVAGPEAAVVASGCGRNDARRWLARARGSVSLSGVAHAADLELARLCAAGDEHAWETLRARVPAGALSRRRRARPRRRRSRDRRFAVRRAVRHQGRTGDAAVALPLLPGTQQSRDLAARGARAALRRSAARAATLRAAARRQRSRGRSRRQTPDPRSRPLRGAGARRRSAARSAGSPRAIGFGSAATTCRS